MKTRSPSGAWQWTRDQDIITVTLDLSEEKINKLTSSILIEFSELLTQVAQEKNLRAMVIRSGKPDMFIAGADIAEIQNIVSHTEGEAKSKSGQAIFTHLSRLPFPTVALIEGVALGGGLELALACTYRIVTDSPKTILGLPEVNLGILPGFGGTQRLPRLIGIVDSLPLILTGKTVNGPQAYKSGLADRCCAPSFLETELSDFLNQVSKSKFRKSCLARRRSKGLVQWFLNRTTLGVTLVSRRAKKEIISKTKGQYPAPLLALEAVKQGYFRSLSSGQALESKFFSKLVTTSISKNLIYLFYAQEALKKESGVASDVIAHPISQAGVLGAGLMGGGIAWALSEAAISVRIKDISWDAISKAYQAAHAFFNKKKVSKLSNNLGMHRISGSLTYTGFSKTEVVIEAIVEDMILKKKVFQELETHLPADTLIASNTSALSITELATALNRPGRFVGMHFFSPVNRMPLVEVIPGEKTDAVTVATIVRLAKSLKKTPIVVKDCPGFLVNRILIPYVNEAVRLYSEGVHALDLDRIMTTFGMPIGPLALADEVGLDIGYKVAKILENGYGSRMAISPLFESIYANPNLRGKKTGYGFYDHTRFKSVPNPKMKALLTPRKGKKPKTQECEDRMILIMINEAARCIEESVVAKSTYLDIAMVLGTGFPPFRGGLLRYADSLGIENLVKKLDILHAAYGERFEAAGLLRQMAEDKISFMERESHATHR